MCIHSDSVVAEGRFESRTSGISVFREKILPPYIPTRDTRTHKIGVELYVELVVKIFEFSKDWTSLPFSISRI
jgi:hypothetical protein